ncbi:unnamed protein product [Gongylonema pulchrum]|uniref:Integrase_SAM-like_N domain-containing protein n=1 Tax=Gongylonema pulchrum TaxID=637853 RepID=A0A183DQ71_9BILA|nr:unnamed protein product [Gongylonema pulchrum]
MINGDSDWGGSDECPDTARQVRFGSRIKKGNKGNIQEFEAGIGNSSKQEEATKLYKEKVRSFDVAMGVSTCNSDQQAQHGTEMTATKPKERQFQIRSFDVAMGVSTCNSDQQAQHGTEMTATKPKERQFQVIFLDFCPLRQFQVVPVPGTFTRGRWKCWDYKDKTSETVIDFTDKSEKHTARTFTRGRWKCWDYKDKTSETVIDFTDKSEKHTATINLTENVASYVATPSTQTDPINHTLSEPRLSTTVDSGTGLTFHIAL